MNLFGAGVLLILLGGTSAMLLSRRSRVAEWVFCLTVIAGCGASGVAALRVLAGQPAGAWMLQPTLPGGAWVIRLDGLSAWFLLLAIVGSVTTLFGVTLRVAGFVAGVQDTNRAISVDLGSAVRLGWFGALILLAVVGAWVLRRALLGRVSRRMAATWGRAYPAPTARMQYTAASFSSPILTAFSLPASPGRPRLEEPDGTMPSDRVMRNVARPLWDKLQTLALSVRSLQQGRITTYLKYMIWTVILLLGFLLFASTGRQP